MALLPGWSLTNAALVVVLSLTVNNIYMSVDMNKTFPRELLEAEIAKDNYRKMFNMYRASIGPKQIMDHVLFSHANKELAEEDKEALLFREFSVQNVLFQRVFESE